MATPATSATGAPAPPTSAAEALRQVTGEGRRARQLDRASELDAAFLRLRERHGSDVDVLRNAQAPGADRARVCAMTIALYSELIALPPGTAGATLRHVLGPAEPAAAAPPPPTGR
jgi:hypothetical protein